MSPAYGGEAERALAHGKATGKTHGRIFAFPPPDISHMNYMLRAHRALRKIQSSHHPLAPATASREYARYERHPQVKSFAGSEHFSNTPRPPHAGILFRAELLP